MSCHVSDSLSQGHVNKMLTVYWGCDVSSCQLITATLMIFTIQVSSVLVFRFYESQAPLLQNYAHITSRCLEMHAQSPSLQFHSFNIFKFKQDSLKTALNYFVIIIFLFFFSSQFGMVCSHCTVVPVKGAGFISEVWGCVYVCSARDTMHYATVRFDDCSDSFFHNDYYWVHIVCTAVSSSVVSSAVFPINHLDCAIVS